ncbi:MAG: LAGLIDADG family homing endonuclease [Candidatus Omnitrophica bacterium]|nr:LAGLIDADG family homing endonuclease [Candidatus Omnitrophota bacterium]
MPNKRKELKIEGANLWYLVGLIATDGCLCTDGRHIDITSQDFQFLQAVEEATGIKNKIGAKYNGRNQRSFHIQIGNKNLYNFLVSIGLSQNKSLTLGALEIPNEYFMDFLRGVIDGDGCIRSWVHPSNKREQWSLRIYSGSEDFINWLSDTIIGLLEIFGKVYKSGDNLWVLKYGKMAAREIARQCYYKDCFGLKRKIELAKQCLGSYKGWDKSATVCCEPV